MMDWLEDWWPGVAFGAVCVALIVVFVHFDNIERAEWAAFQTAHHCAVVGREAGFTTSGSGLAVTSKGAAPVFTSEYHSPRVTWRCDDGVNYTRDE